MDVRITRTIFLAAVAFAVAIALLATIAGHDEVRDRVRGAEPIWLLLVIGGGVVAGVGYILAYRGIAEIDGGPSLRLRDAIVLVAVGFGAFLAKGGEVLDSRALRSDVRDVADGEVRVLALDALEHAALAPAAWAAALTMLANGRRKPGLDFTVPWAVLVPVGTVVALWAVSQRARYAGSHGLRGILGKTLEGINILFRMLARWRTFWPAFAGSAIYWAGDVASLWAAARVFYDRPSVPAVILAHAVGYVLTRRTLPLAGAGIVELLMPLTLAAAGVPFAAAVAGVVVYRIVNLWLPLVPALLALPSAQRFLARQAEA